MKDEIRELIRKAERSIDASKVLCDRGDYDFAISRAYYATFYMASACLLSLGLTFSKHSGAIASFNQHFIKTGIFNERYFKILRNAFNQRNISDYELLISLSEEIAKALIDDANDFLQETNKYLRSND